MADRAPALLNKRQRRALIALMEAYEQAEAFADYCTGAREIREVLVAFSLVAPGDENAYSRMIQRESFYPPSIWLQGAKNQEEKRNA